MTLDALAVMAPAMSAWQPPLAHGFYFSTGSLILLFVLLWGPFILGGLLLLAAGVLAFWKRRAALVCLIVGVLFCLGGGVVWTMF